MPRGTPDAAWEAAAAYDAWFESRWGSYAWEVEARLLSQAAGDFGGGQVLDVGCGTGRFGMLARDAGADVTGLDRSLGMARVATDRLDRVVVGDAARLPFTDGAFDVTLAVTVLEFVDDPSSVVAEMARTTTAGGLIVVATLDPRSPWGLLHRRELRRPPWASASFLTETDLRELAAPYGDVTTAEGLHAPGAASGLRLWGRPWERLAGRLGVPGAFRVTRIERR